MQLDDVDVGDTGKEKDARSPCGMTRDDDTDRQRRQCEKDEDDVLAEPAFIVGATADDADALLGAKTLPPPLPAGAAVAPAADGDGGHHVERDADARKVTRCDWDAAVAAADTSAGATALLRLALRSFGAGCRGGGRGFLVRLGRRKHVHLRTPLTGGGSVAPLAILGRSGGGGRGLLLLVCRGSDGRGATGTFTLAQAMGGCFAISRWSKS